MSNRLPGLGGLITAVRDRATARALERLVEIVGIWKGERGSQLDRVVTMRDLKASGIATVRASGSGAVTIEPGGASGSSGSVEAPVAPTGVAVAAAFRSVVIAWDAPGYRGHSYTEVWRSSVDDLGSAAPVGMAPGRVFADSDVEGGQTYYYWVRFVNRNDVAGPYNATAGIKATLASDASTLLDKLAEQITESELAQNLQSRINLIDTPTSGLVDRMGVVQNDVATVDGRVDANVDAISGIDARVDMAEDEIVGHGQTLDALSGTVYDPITGVSATASAVSSANVRIGAVEGDLEAQAGEISQFRSDINGNSAAIQQQSSTVNGLKAQWTVKIDNNGHVSGIGLASESAEDNRETSSAFIVQADRIAFVPPSLYWSAGRTVAAGQYVRPSGQGAGLLYQAEGAGTTGATEPVWPTVVGDTVLDNDITFTATPLRETAILAVDAETGLVVMRGALIEKGSVGDLQVSNVAADKIFATSGTIAQALIGDGHIGNAMIGNVIQSNDYTPGGPGWRILKSGTAEFNNAIVRGLVDGAKVRASTIEGSTIVGSAFVAPTELDPGNNTLLGLTSTLSWQDSVSGTSPDNGSVSRMTQFCDIRSANYSDTSHYRRFRRHRVNATVSIDFGVDGRQAGFEWVRVIVYNESAAVVNTGARAGNASGTYWNLVLHEGTYESCFTDCTGHTQCQTRNDLRGATFTLQNYPYSGDGRLRFYVTLVNNAYGYGIPFTATASMTAYNDY